MSFIMEALIKAAIICSLRWLSTPYTHILTHTTGACRLPLCEVSTSMAAATWVQRSVIVMVTNVNYYAAVDIIQQHTLGAHTAHLNPAVCRKFALCACVKQMPHVGVCAA